MVLINQPVWLLFCLDSASFTDFMQCRHRRSRWRYKINIIVYETKLVWNYVPMRACFTWCDAPDDGYMGRVLNWFLSSNVSILYNKISIHTRSMFRLKCRVFFSNKYSIWKCAKKIMIKFELNYRYFNYTINSWIIVSFISNVRGNMPV